MIRTQASAEESTLMPQLLFQDRGDMKRASVGLLTHYLVDFLRTPDAKTSLRLLTQKQISEVATTSECRPLELVAKARNAVRNQKQSIQGSVPRFRSKKVNLQIT